MPTPQMSRLPDAEQRTLAQLRESNDLHNLRLRVLALRKANWTLRAIGEPLDAQRSTVRMWEQAAVRDMAQDASLTLPDVPKSPRTSRAVGEKVVRLRPNVPQSDRDELKRLAESARTVRGWTPKDAQSRRDADKLDEMLLTYTRRRVPVKYLADYMGVTYRAVAARMERYKAKLEARENERHVGAA